MNTDRLFTDGVLVVDKPSGPTSHDVVAVTRRVLRRVGAAGAPPSKSRRGAPIKVGHTGTLDPLASGVLPLVLGKATRLAQFLSASDKEYVADVELGVSTNTLDRGGEVIDRPKSREVESLTRAMIEEAVAAFQGTYFQLPPDYSAKKVDGDRAYDLARRNEPLKLRPVEVTARSLEVLEWKGSLLKLRLVCSPGYYVRSLADDLGSKLGTGAHLAALVRTRSGDFGLKDAVALDDLDRQPEAAAARVIPLASLLPALPSVILTPAGAALAARGGFIGPSHCAPGTIFPAPGRVRLLHPDGHLVAVAAPRAGAADLLHPSVVLE